MFHYSFCIKYKKNTYILELSKMFSGEEIVISGIAGRFPNSENTLDLFNNIRNKKDLFSKVDPFWKSLFPDVPPKLGKLKHETKFDSGYFGIHHHQAETMFGSSRQFLEVAIEAILDSGINPSDLYGTNTGVFIGDTQLETNKEWFWNEKYNPNFGITGRLRSMFANHLSYHLGLQGPSVCCDSACSSSLYSLEQAFASIRAGKCDRALVGASHITDSPYVYVNSFRMGVLDPKSESKIFDKDEKGYVKSEAVVVILVQKLKEARRVYSEILNIKINCDGFKKEGILYPSGKSMARLYREVCSEVNVDPSLVTFIECHATGTTTCTLEELRAIKDVFLVNRKTPLLVGSVKSNLGHTEGSSGLCSLVKMLIGFQNNCILPHLNCTNLRDDIEVLRNGEIIVPGDCMYLDPEKDVVAGISNCGFGGANGYMIIKHHKRSLFPSNPTSTYETRLVCASGRTMNSINCILDLVGTHKDKYIALLQNLFRKDLAGFPYRGYVIVKNGIVVKKSIIYCEQKTTLRLKFTNASKAWMKVYNDVRHISKIVNTLQRMHNMLLSKNFNLFALLNDQELITFSQMLTVTVALQIAISSFLIDLIQSPISKSYGIGSGVIASLFFNKELSVEEAILVAYQLGTRLTPDTPEKASLEELDLVLKDFNYSMGNNDDINSQSIVLTIGPKCETDQHFCTLYMCPIDEKCIILNTLGRLYELGFQLNLERLYSNQGRPVRAPLIPPLIEWNHDHDWHVYRYKPKMLHKKVVSISLENSDWKFLSGHVVNGLNLFPATGYLYLAWTFYAEINHLHLDEVKIVLEDVKFLRSCLLSKGGHLNLTIEISKISKRFEIRDGDDCLVTGKINATSRNDDQENIFSYLINNAEPTMNSKEVYKKFNLHGYNYTNNFCGLEEVDITGTCGKVRWHNWITFIESLAQLTIIKMRLKGLYLPTKIGRIVIDQREHQDHIKKNSLLPVYSSNFAKLLAAPGVQIENLHWLPMNKSSLKKPTLEVYKFVPFRAYLSREDSIVVHTQLILENLKGKLKVVEVIDEYSEQKLQVFGEMMERACENQIFVAREIIIYSLKNVNGYKLPVKYKRISDIELDTSLIVLSKASQRAEEVTKIFNKIPKVFILSREVNPFEAFDEADVLSVHHTELESFILLRKAVDVNFKVVEVTNKNFKWLPQLQYALPNNKKVLLLAQNEPTSGILGLMNCLKFESNNVSCCFLMDENVQFNSQSNFYKNQLKKNLLVNVLKNGEWGTYRHLPLNDSITTACEQAISNVTKGDISSTRWVQGKLSKDNKKDEETLIHVFYAAINFKDTVVASGRINITNENHDDANLGWEFSGKDSRGERVMGIIPTCGISNLISTNKYTLFKIPSQWSMEEAATVPLVYQTVLYALLECAKLKHRQSILIHSGVGGVGQAAINVASYFNCNIFTTVGSAAKKLYLKNLYPALKDEQIGNSRDTSFETMVLKQTRGRGVDVVINSLSEEKLQAGLRCLALKGKFIEIGKYDLLNDRPFPIITLANRCSLFFVHLDIFFDTNINLNHKVMTLLKNGIDMNYVKPLPRTIFKKENVASALQYMSGGAHTGKVLIKIRNEMDTIKAPLVLQAEPRYYCDPKKVYVVVGGLGGFGLELIDWLIERGGRYFIIVSRNGISTGYQQFKANRWSKVAVKAVILKRDLSQLSECKLMLLDASRFGVIDAIFNLTLVLRDALIENQTEDTFMKVLLPIATITENLDTISRELCPDLRQFVTFSSVCCGRGNIGQTNYGMGNSIIERICERRKADGLPALSIQWGLVGDVGVVAETIKRQQIAGVIEQKLASCLDVMNFFLTQDQTIVSSCVLSNDVKTKSSREFLSEIADILGKDTKHVALHIPLTDLGLDSTSTTQMKQFLANNYNLYLTSRELRNTSIFKLQERLVQVDKMQRTHFKHVCFDKYH
ncbi:hypothetical protein FQA39_LY16263 [Lamprigera yunnana]|nr:hypothetical protein FQA39_LY16263 [Lamprigera yunnana]